MVEATNDPYEGNKLKEDIKRRFEPQILRETGVIGHKKGSLEMLKDKYSDSESIFKNDLEKSVNKKIDDKTFKNYKEKRTERIDKYIENIHEKGIKGKSFDQMSEEEQRDEITYLKAKATREVKEEVFGKQKETKEEKKDDKKLSKERATLYKK